MRKRIQIKADRRIEKAYGGIGTLLLLATGFLLNLFSRSNQSTVSREVVTENSSTSLPEFHTSGRQERWLLGADDPDEKNYQGAKGSGFLDFLGNLASTAKDWSDNAAIRMPDVRDRVVTVFKGSAMKGGLNLNLKGEDILDLAYQRAPWAGWKLVRKFATNPVVMNPALDGAQGWLDHRWVRFNTYVAALKAHLQGFNQASNQAYGVSSIADQIESAVNVPPLKRRDYFEPGLTPAQAKALKEALQAIQALEKSLAEDKVVQPYQGRPQPELKTRPRL